MEEEFRNCNLRVSLVVEKTIYEETFTIKVEMQPLGLPSLGYEHITSISAKDLVEAKLLISKIGWVMRRIQANKKIKFLREEVE